jgi:GT2 family glycosyltransferase
MKLCVPTLCRYDLLERLIRSAEAGSLLPSGYVIIDNGGSYSRETLNALLGERAALAELITPGENLGVAASWNRFLDLAGDETVVISNDDVVLARSTFADIAHELHGHDFVGDGWALFAQTAECTRRAGYYDENFWPGYHEDCDYDLRLDRARVRRRWGGATRAVEHESWASTRALGNPDWINDGRLRNRAYFVAKWGAENPRWEGPADAALYSEPFNGRPPPGWSERTRVSPLPLRWELLNTIAKRIGAKRYLEIGVADGSCMRRIEIRERWGVDPIPQPGAVSASTVLVPQTSDTFFQKLRARAGKFDLVLIDGDHRAEQARRDVQDALELLTPQGVIVLHDCNPHTREMQEVPLRRGWQWTGDVWKAVVRLRLEGKHAVRVVNSDYGIGIVVPHATPEQMRSRPRALAWLDWEDLVADRDDLLGLVSGWEWQDWFETALASRTAA